MIEKCQNQTTSKSSQNGGDWKLDLPAYTSGTLDTTLYSCGYGKNAGNTEEKSVMHLINNTTAEEFSRYLVMLENNGYTKTFENAIDGNRYAAFTDAQGNLFYMYYMETVAENTVLTQYDRRVHVIHDRSSNTTLNEFCYAVDPDESTEFYAFNLNTVGEDTLLIHTADNAWIMIDGGVTDWSTHVYDPEGKFADSIYQFMRARSGLDADEKLVISAWYLTHAHRDHFLAFDSMIKRNHEGILLERMIANVPDMQVIYNSNNAQFLACMDTVNTYYPDLKFLKAHAGMKLQLADVSFTVLMAQESLIHYWYSNKEEYNAHWKHWSEDCSICGGDCRLYYKQYDFNNSSVVTKIDIRDMTIFSTGDAYRMDRWIVPFYSMETLDADILKVAHHFNNHELVANDRAGNIIDKSKYYWRVMEKRADEELYALVTNASYDKGASAKPAWEKAFEKSPRHHFITSRYDMIFGFKKKNGSVIKTDYQAAYSYIGGIDHTAK